MTDTSTTPDVKLSVLDSVGLFDGESAVEALERSTAAARLVERLGYTRLWFAEHHNNRHQMSMSPDLLIAHIAALTTHLQVGVGGLQLPNHSPLRIVENYSTLAALHPGRIDLGMGRAASTDAYTNVALRNSEETLDGPALMNMLMEVLAFFDHEFPVEHHYRGISPSPDPSLRPELFMLGSSTGGMQIASQLGTGFTFSGQLNPTAAIPVLKKYRTDFVPSNYRAEPYSILSMIVVCAESDEEARALAAPLELQWARWDSGQRHHAPPTFEHAAAYQYSPTEERARRRAPGRFIVGTGEHVAAQLRQLATDAQVDELMTVNMIPDHQAQLKSCELLADAFGLTPRQ